MKTTARHVFRLFLQEIRPQKWGYLLLSLMIISAEVSGIIAPLYYKRFFDLLATGVPSAETAMKLRDVLLIVVAFYAVQWAVKCAAAFLRTRLDARVMASLEKRAFDYVLGHSYSYFANSFVGSLTHKVRRLATSYAMISENVEWTFLPTVTVVIASAVVLFTRSVPIAIALLVWFALYTGVSYAFALWKMQFDVRRTEADSAATAIVADSLANSTNVKIFTGREHEQSLFGKTIDRWRKAATFTWGLADANEMMQWGLMIVLEFGVLFGAISFWQRGLLTIGDFALIQSYVIALFMRVWDLGRTIRKTYEAVGDANEMVEIMHLPYEIKDARHATALELTKGRIEFDDIDFSYGKTRRVLHGFNLNIRPRERVALVGPSGAGKSTITKLLLRFHDVNGGTIKIDGQDIAIVTQDSLREKIALVPQEPILFHRSLMDNIRYGRRDATDEEVIDAAMKAHCHEFISDLPDGYRTFVGERGVKLSGGERQRVAIARAILKDAPILVLDEATSSLDSESEALIQDALEELMKNKTTIVIAHRLSTILKMDRIVVVDHGKVVNTGTHKSLMKKVGLYKTLWEIQAGGFAE